MPIEGQPAMHVLHGLIITSSLNVEEVGRKKMYGPVIEKILPIK
jgi:hypothetical protein